MNILLVEDDRELVDVLVYSFHRAGFITSVAHDAQGALTRFESEGPDLVVLDIQLGSTSGFDVLRALRAKSDVPIIVLTALDSEEDRVRGLTLGADDYLTKPFSHRELITRINAQLRRRGQTVARPMADRLQVGDLELDATTHVVRRAGEVKNLTVTEFRLLYYLMANAGQVVSTANVLRHVWGQSERSDSDVLRVTLHRLRRKLGEDKQKPALLQTLPGVGVLLRADGETKTVVPAATDAPSEGAAPPTGISPAATAPVASAPAPLPVADRQLASSAGWVRPLDTSPEAARVLVRIAELESPDRIRLRFTVDAELEAALLVTHGSSLTAYDASSDEVTWTVPYDGPTIASVLELARRRGFAFGEGVPEPEVVRKPEEAVVATDVSAAAAAAATVVAPAPRQAPSLPAMNLAEVSGAVRGIARQFMGILARPRGAPAQSDGATLTGSASVAAAEPASELAAESAGVTTARVITAPAISTSAEGVSAREVSRDLSGRGRIAVGLLLVSALIAAFSIWSQSVELSLLGKLASGESIPANQLNASNVRQAIVGVSLLLAYLATAITFLRWLSSSYRRLTTRGVKGLHYSPNQAVLWFFVPIAFLFMPYRVVRELWSGSELPAGARVSDGPRGGVLVAGWWLVFLGFALASLAATVETPPATELTQRVVTQLTQQGVRNLVSDVLAIIASALTILLIVLVDHRHARAEAVGPRRRRQSPSTASA